MARDLLAERTAWFNDRREAINCELVTVSCGKRWEIEDVKASICDHDDEITDQGILIQRTGVDFVISRDQFEQCHGEPGPGWTITRTVNGQKEVYEARPMGDDGYFRPHDRYGKSWRIHTDKTKVIR